MFEVCDDYAIKLLKTFTYSFPGVFLLFVFALGPIPGSRIAESYSKDVFNL